MAANFFTSIAICYRKIQVLLMFFDQYYLLKSASEEEGIESKPKKRKKRYPFLGLCLTILFLFLGYRNGFARTFAQESTLWKTCRNPTLRKEWRELSISDKHHYIESVLCLKDAPSRLGMNHSLYDDFPWVHAKTRSFSHFAAGFLSWHRYFLHIYERALKEQCGYQGYLPYWNWTLDYQDMRTSPVWDIKDGFGGSGNSSFSEKFFEGYCLTEGPFANLEIPYTNLKYDPHCLTRGFVNDESVPHVSQNITPKAVEKILRKKEFEQFLLAVEDGPHLTVPKIVRGDFTLFTAPSDPIFFLHHAQLDHLWWIWQQADLPSRQMEYAGKASYNSLERASLQDSIPMLGLAPTIIVRDVMNTVGNILCYMY